MSLQRIVADIGCDASGVLGQPFPRFVVTNRGSPICDASFGAQPDKKKEDRLAKLEKYLAEYLARLARKGRAEEPGPAWNAHGARGVKARSPIPAPAPPPVPRPVPVVAPAGAVPQPAAREAPCGVRVATNFLRKYLDKTQGTIIEQYASHMIDNGFDCAKAILLMDDSHVDMCIPRAGHALIIKSALKQLRVASKGLREHGDDADVPVPPSPAAAASASFSTIRRRGAPGAPAAAAGSVGSSPGGSAAVTPAAASVPGPAPVAAAAAAAVPAASPGVLLAASSVCCA